MIESYSLIEFIPLDVYDLLHDVEQFLVFVVAHHQDCFLVMDLMMLIRNFEESMKIHQVTLLLMNSVLFDYEMLLHLNDYHLFL